MKVGDEVFLDFSVLELGIFPKETLCKNFGCSPVPLVGRGASKIETKVLRCAWVTCGTVEAVRFSLNHITVEWIFQTLR